MKDSIKANFGAGARYYQDEAELQRDVAVRLGMALEPWRFSLPSGPVLELGAGTGFFTRELLRFFRGREIVASDISEEMLALCRECTSGMGNTTYRVIDAEEWDPPPNKYALIGGNFVAQWFRDPAAVLEKYLNALKPGGLLLLSFPGSESFPEWKEQCVELGLPFTRNPLPDIEELVVKLSLKPVKVDFYEESRTLNFKHPLDFFRHLKRLGAATRMGAGSLPTARFRLLIREWDKKLAGSIRVTYHVVFLAVKRNHE